MFCWKCLKIEQRPAVLTSLKLNAKCFKMLIYRALYIYIYKVRNTIAVNCQWNTEFKSNKKNH